MCVRVCIPSSEMCVYIIIVCACVHTLGHVMHHNKNLVKPMLVIDAGAGRNIFVFLMVIFFFVFLFNETSSSTC